MSEVIHLEFPHEDARALFRQMENAVKYLNYDAGKALGSAARFLARSLGASTRVAPKYREFVEINDDLTKANNRRGVKTFAVRGWFGKPRQLKTKTVNAKSVATLKRYHAKIGNRGLAKATWGIAFRQVAGGASSMSNIANEVARKARDYVSTDKRTTGADPYVLITNELPYIQEAMTGGPQDISSAMARAASAMEQSIEKQLVKRMGLGSLSR